MDVRLTDEQELLRDTAARLAGAHAPASVHDLEPDVRATRAEAAWRAVLDAGLVGLDVPEAAGGMGATAVEVALVAEQLGAATSVAPYLGQGVLAPAVLAASRADELAAVLDGTARVAVAMTRDLRGFAGAVGATVAWDALGASAAVGVDEAGQAWWWDLEGDELAGLDHTRTSVQLSSTPRPVGAAIAPDARMRLDALAYATVAADLVGVMQRALDDAVAYASQRVQFGVPIGSFQAIQHLAADAAVLVEGSRSSTWHGAWAVGALDALAADTAARQAKAFASRAGRTVVEIGVQLHGGVAITWEHPAHIGVRRALHDAVSFGDVGTHLRTLADRRLGPADRLASRAGS